MAMEAQDMIMREIDCGLGYHEHSLLVNHMWWLCRLVCDISLFMAFKGVEDSLLTPTFSGSTDEH